MNRTLKWLLIGGGALLVLLIAAIILIPLMVDVNSYKPQIEAKVQDATGRSFKIGGDIELSVFPWVGLSLSDLQLGSPQGFKEPELLKVGDFEARVKLLPLLSRQVEIKRVVLQDPQIVLVKNKGGQTNWEFKSAANKTAPAKEEAKDTASKTSSGFALQSVTAEEIAIKNGSLTFIDHASGKRQEVSELNLALSDVSLDGPVKLTFSTRINNQPLKIEGTAGPLGNPPGSQPLTFDMKISALDELQADLKGSARDLTGKPSFDMALEVDDFSPRKLLERLGQPLPVQTSDSNALNKVSLKANVKGSTTQVSVENGVLVLDDTKTDFTLAAKDFSRPNLAFDVKMDNLDLDRYLPAKSKETAAKAPAGDGSQPAPKTKKTDYAPLRRLVLDGSLAIGKLKAAKARMQNVRFQIAARDGRFRIEPLACELYGGTANISGTMDVNQSQPRTDLKLNLDKVAGGPLIKDVAQKDIIEGLLNSQVNLQFQGDNPDRIKQTLNGGGQLTFSDGAIKGLDLGAMVRNVQAAFGEGGVAADGSQTEFTELSVPFTLRNGTFVTEATQMKSPVIGVKAKGQADLVSEKLNFRVEPEYVATLKGERSSEDLKEIKVPVLVSGTFQKPRFAPDLEAIAKQQVQKQIIDSGKLDEVFEKNEDLKPLEDTAKGLLKGILNQQ
jgi:AsmA protein